MKKYLLWMYRILLLLFIGANVYLLVSGKTFVYTTLLHLNPDLDDYKIFTNREVKNGNVQKWPKSALYNKKYLPASCSEVLQKYNTTAFLIIHNDSLLYERYYENGGKTQLSNSFSVAKSIVNILCGIALKEGKIKSLDEPIGNYLPEYKEGARAQIKIRHLLSMSSGLDWDESYSSLFSPTTEAYYGTDIHRLISRFNVVNTPGTVCAYKTIDVQLLCEVLTKACGESISQYASEKLWKKVGAAQTALWATDHKDGEEKAYCCFSAEASDFARIGQLYLDSGSWKGSSIVDKNFMKLSVKPNMLKDDEGNVTDYYGYLWWVMNYQNENIFYARGIKGQYVIVVPSKRIIIVRLGEDRSSEQFNHHHLEMENMLDAAMNMIK